MIASKHGPRHNQRYLAVARSHEILSSCIQLGGARFLLLALALYGYIFIFV